MHAVTLQQAKTKLAELIEEVIRGNEVLILQADGPAVRLVAVPETEEATEALYPLRGSVCHYERPTDPVAEEDWEAMQ
jgi:prevent-host-death family protein